MDITYRKKNNKYIVCKEGVYMSLTLAQVIEMAQVMNDIINDRQDSYKKDARR
jgi:hypothetical protein